MSIGIYAFLRIIFSALACPLGRALSDTLRRQYTPAAAPIVRRGLSGIECRPVQRVQRPGALGLWSPPAGDTGGAGVGWVDSLRRKNSKKALFLPTHPSFLLKTLYPPLPISKISRKNKKDPYKGSVFCAILALQALKGRNLQ